MLAPSEVFTVLFVTLGPLKLIGPFAQRVHNLPTARVRPIAWRAFAIAVVAAVAGGFLGVGLMENWHVSRPALELAGGIVFLLVALKLLLAQYEPEETTPMPTLPASPMAAACRLVFPVVLTPYGIAALIAMMANSNSAERTMVVIGILIFVLLLDLLAMWFAQNILVGFVPIILQVVGAVLAVMQVGLSVQFILAGLQDLNVIAT